MKKVILAAGLCLLASSALAENVHSKSGANATVAASAAGAFQCLVDGLEAIGYRIHFMGGWRKHGSVRGSLHPAGLALDINQYGRNVVRPSLPAGATGIAQSCGLIHGAVWRNADAGHFQKGGWGGYAMSARRRGHQKATALPAGSVFSW